VRWLVKVDEKLDGWDAKLAAAACNETTVINVEISLKRCVEVKPRDGTGWRSLCWTVFPQSTVSDNVCVRVCVVAAVTVAAVVMVGGGRGGSGGVTVLDWCCAENTPKSLVNDSTDALVSKRVGAQVDQ
jgi:hypothetical protein